MRATYRIDWKSGMRLSDAVFLANDEFHLSQLTPLYELMLRGGYGHLVQPRFRCDVDNQEMSVIEILVRAISPSGELMSVSFSHNDRDLYQGIAMPSKTEPFIVYIEIAENEIDTFTENDIPLRDKRYNLILKAETVNYVGRNAVAIARFEYKQCWMQDMAFIPPCISLHANADLWNLSHLFLKSLKDLITSLRLKVNSEMSDVVLALMPSLQAIAIEIEKEIDEMTPKHLTTLMQTAVAMITDSCDLSGRYVVPDKDSCIAFISTNYNPTNISGLINEGIRLIQILNNLIAGFRAREVCIPEPEPAPVAPVMRRQPRVIDTSSERKSFRPKK